MLCLGLGLGYVNLTAAVVLSWFVEYIHTLDLVRRGKHGLPGSGSTSKSNLSEVKFCFRRIYFLLSFKRHLL